MSHMEDESHMGESTFWYDPHVIPQYDFLVREGRVTREEADEHRQARTQMGLPMTFAELKPRPSPRFAWLLEAGGPAVVDRGEVFDLDGQKWMAEAWGAGDEPGTLRFHDPLVGESGYLCRELSKNQQMNGPAVLWHATYLVPGHDKVYARSHGSAETFAMALAEVRAVDFSAVQTWSGATWYPNGKGWLSVIDGDEVKVEPLPFGDGSQWRWEVRSPAGSPLQRFAALFSTYALIGSAVTRDDAIADALSAPARLRILAAELLAVGAGDEFARGRQAGLAEMKARILSIAA